MEKIIGVQKEGYRLTLKRDYYKIDIVGGWGIRLKEFSVSLKNINTGLILYPQRSFWPIQSYKKGIRSKRIFTIDVLDSGEYEVKFKGLDSLIVKSSNLLFLSLLQKPLSIDQISICVY